MSSPSFLKWCTSSFSSVHQTLSQMMHLDSKGGSEISPFISSIRSLRGRTAGEKYKYLNNIVREIVENAQSTNFTTPNDIPMALIPYIQTMVATAAVELKMSDLICEGLKSDNISIVKKALKADWFFDGSNESVNANNFNKNILPFVSVRTRAVIIKKLSYSLKRHQDKAQDFFETFVESYGVEVSSPILRSCSKTFIFRQILNHKLVLSVKLVESLYEIYPDLVIEYLQLGNKANEKNSKEREIFEIQIDKYYMFLPKIIQKYPVDFVQLYEMIPDKKIKLSHSKSVAFLEKSKKDLLDKPHIFLKLLPLRLVSRTLNKKQFAMMYENLFPKSIDDFNLDQMLDYMQYYPPNDKFELLKTKYKKMYNVELIHDDNIKTSTRLFKIFPANEKRHYAKLWIEKREKSLTMYNEYTHHLPPKESIPVLQKKIVVTTKSNERLELLCKMIKSCSFYDNKTMLFEVLKYYKDWHKNEEILVLYKFLLCLKEEFELKTLKSRHWKVIREILHYFYMKTGILEHSYMSLISTFLEEALRDLMTNQKDNQVEMDKLINMKVKLNMENSFLHWNVLKNRPAQERECMNRFFSLIPEKYPEDHSIWENRDDKLEICLSVVRSISDFNKRNAHSRSRKTGEENASRAGGKLDMEEHPWILSMAGEFFSRAEVGYRKKLLMQYLRRSAPDAYEAKLDEMSSVRSIKTGEALALLRRDPRKIARAWPDYLAEAQGRLYFGCRAAKRFVAATKWNSDISTRFVERCMVELRERGSIIVLGILLEGSVFEKLISAYVPRDDKTAAAGKNYEMTRSILVASRCSNPPVSLDALGPFCQGDYARAAEATLMNIAHNVPVGRVLGFAASLADSPIPAKKCGLRMVEGVASKPVLRQFLLQTWQSETHAAKRQIVAKMIFEIFVKLPELPSWELMRDCLDGLTVDDGDLIVKLSDIKWIHVDYVSEYVDELLGRIELLSKTGLDEATRVRCVCLVVDSLEPKLAQHVSEETCRMILDRHFFDANSLEISEATQKFVVRSYLTRDGKFEKRLSFVMASLARVMEKFDTPHPRAKHFYTPNYTVQRFLGFLLKRMSGKKNEYDSLIVYSVLKIFNSVLSPWQEPMSYLSFNLYHEYLMTNTPRDFGFRCAVRTAELVEEFSANESVINDVANCLNNLMTKKIYREMDYASMKLTVIEGLLEGDDFYGALLTAKLFKSNEVKDYDDRYKKIVGYLRNKHNKNVQYDLYKHLNKVKFKSQKST